MSKFHTFLSSIAAACVFSSAAMASSYPVINAGAGSNSGDVAVVYVASSGLIGVRATNIGAAGAVTMVVSLESANLPKVILADCLQNSFGCLPALGNPTVVTVTMPAGSTDTFLVGVNAAKQYAPGGGEVVATFYDANWCVIGSTAIALDVVN